MTFTNQTKIKSMKTTTATSTSFQTAIFAVLSTASDCWPQPVIYAEEIDGEMRFDACNAPAMPSDATPWMFVQADSFGDLTGDHESDARGICSNLYEQAVNDIRDEIERQDEFTN